MHQIVDKVQKLFRSFTSTFVKNHEAVDVSVADLQQTTDAVAVNTTDNMTTTTTDQNNQPASTSTGKWSDNNSKRSSATKTKSSTTEDNSTASTDKTAHKAVVVHHRKAVAQPASGETKAVAYSSNHHNKYAAERSRRSMARAIAWKRQNTVADALLKNGIPKVKVIAQDQPVNDNAPKGVQVVLVHGRDEFYKHMNEAPAGGQPVSANP